MQPSSPCFFRSPAPALCRHRAPAAATEALDVEASHSPARAAVSTSPSPPPTPMFSPWRTNPSGSSGRLAQRLHSRDFLPEEQGQHESYRSLVLARLRRESARAAALSARASLAADGVSRANLRPANATPVFEASAAEIQGPGGGDTAPT